MRQVMLLPEQIERLHANWKVNERHRNRTGKTDFQPVVKLFSPVGAATWLLTELDPGDNDTAFGLCDLGMGEPEMGYVSLDELRSITFMGGALYIERDEHFTPNKTLMHYWREARTAGRIVA
jgi:hypothetical protein